jgi:hypothetical protein
VQGRAARMNSQPRPLAGGDSGRGYRPKVLAAAPDLAARCVTGQLLGRDGGSQVPPLVE